jgi:hypothetical protein
MMRSDIIEPSLSLLCKLGSIVVHADEATEPDASGNLITVKRHFDIAALRALLDDPEVKDWIKGMGALLPLKRSVQS